MKSHSQVKVVFLEDRAQAQWVEEHMEINPQTTLIALTAVAIHALDELDLAYTPVSAVASTYALASTERQSSRDCYHLLYDIETWLLEKHFPAAQIGRGFLTGLAYYLQLSIGGVATRAHLMREAIRTFTPSSVILFQGEINPWFRGDGYERNPWVEFLVSKSDEYGCQLQVVDLPRTSVKKFEWERQYERLRSFVHGQAKKVFRLIKRDWSKTVQGSGSIRLLLADADHYEWGSVLNVLRTDNRFLPVFLKSAFLTDRRWLSHYYQDTVIHGSDSKGESLDCEPIRFDQIERDVLSSLLDEWIAGHPSRAVLNVLGMDLFPAMLPHLRSLLALAVPLGRYSTEISIKVLESARPHAACFNSLTRLSSKILAEQARVRGIPVVAYQHGGSYGVQDVPTHDFGEFAHADYFLCYGSGIGHPKDSIVPIRAHFIPVGSNLIESAMKKMRATKRNKSVIRVLWIGEVSEGNVVGGAWLVEDTTRYLLEKRCLEILNVGGIQTMYRPFPQNRDALAIPDWLDRAGLSSVHLDANRSLAKSIQESDVVICDSSSSTTWNETLALGKPLIVYCDPNQTHLMDHFAKDLEQACYWCKSVPDLLEAMERLVKEKTAFVDELLRRISGEYLRKYVLHEGRSVDHVLSFLSEISATGVSYG